LTLSLTHSPTALIGFVVRFSSFDEEDLLDDDVATELRRSSLVLDLLMWRGEASGDDMLGAKADIVGDIEVVLNDLLDYLIVEGEVADGL